MATLVFGAIGAGIGNAIGGTFLGLSAASIGWSVGSMLGGVLFAEKPPAQYGPRLGDLKVQASTYGAPIPKVYGSMRLAGNMIWSKPIKETQHEEDVGGKGGSSQTMTTYSYSQSFAIAICEGPIQAIRRIWANGELIYNVAEDASSETVTASNTLAAGFSFYAGSETQTANSLMQADVGVANCPAYRGIAYIVFHDLPLAEFGNRTPNLEFDVVSVGSHSITSAPHVATALPDYGVFGAASADGALLYLSDWSATSVSVINAYTGALVASIALSHTGSPFITLTSDARGIVSGAHNISVFSTETYEVLDTVLPLGGHQSTAVRITSGNHLAWVATKAIGQIYAIDLTDYTASLIDNLNTVFDIAVTKDSAHVYAAGGHPFTGSDRPGIYVYSTAARSRVAFIPISGVTSPPLMSMGNGVCCVYVPHSSQLLLIDTNTHKITASLTVVNVFSMCLSKHRNVLYLLSTPSGLTTIDLDTGTVIDTLPVASPREHLTESADGSFLFLRHQFVSTQIIAIHLASRTVGSFNAASDWITGLSAAPDGSLYAYHGFFYLKKFTRSFPRATLTSGATALSSIVTSICAEVGVTAVTTTGLTDQLTGYMRTQRGPARGQIEPLMAAYAFDAVEVDNTIRFIKRGGSAVATLPEADLAAHQWGSEEPDAVLIERTQDVELPDEVTINYMDADAHYEIGAQYGRRLIGSSRSKKTVSMAIAISATKAKQIADVLMFDAWQGRTALAFSAGLKYAHLTPADVIQVEKAGNLYTARIVSKNEQSGIITFDAVLEDSHVYTQTAPAPSLPTPPGDVPLPSPTQLLLLDIPLLRDQDNGYGLYAAAGGYTNTWRGCQIYRSTDGELTWVTYGSAILSPTTMGNASTALGNFTQNIFDETNAVTVALHAGALESTTELAVLNGANAALIGQEIIQFKNATMIADKTYVLSGLLRGRKGTEWAAGIHGSGDRFVLLNAATLTRVPAQNAIIGQPYSYRAVTINDYLDTTASQQFSYQAVADKPYAPVRLGGGRNAAGDITITWIRRSRLANEWTDYSDIPVGEESESYQVEIWDSTYSTLKRTFVGLSSPTTSYVAAQQTADFGAPQPSIHCRIFQLSATLGRGTPLQGLI